MKWNLAVYAAALVLLAGCNSTNTTTENDEVKVPTEQSGTEDSKENGTETETETETQTQLTPEEVMNETEKQLNTGVPAKLPKNLTVSLGYHLTAMTRSGKNQYSVAFFETQQPTPMNHEELKNKEVNVATLKATRYETAELAAEQINHQLHSESGAQSVDLGFDIKGYQDAGAGSQFIGWNEGRWSLDMRALTEQGDMIVEESKKVVQYLEKNTLPIPHELGAIKFDVSETSGSHLQHIAWQENEIVYEIETTKSYMDALHIAVSIYEKSVE